MTFEEGLVIELEKILVKKVYPNSVPEGIIVPYIVYSKTSTEYERELQNPIMNERAEQYEIEVYTARKNEANNYGELIISKLREILQTCIGIDGPFVQEVEIINRLSSRDDFTLRYKENIEFKVWY